MDRQKKIESFFGPKKRPLEVELEVETSCVNQRPRVHLDLNSVTIAPTARAPSSDPILASNIESNSSESQNHELSVSIFYYIILFC